jgi:abortive infection bacteriophage resistance protein
MNRPTYAVPEQITLLKRRGMLFRDEMSASIHLRNYGYYRLKGYWRDCQDPLSHQFHPDIYFEAIMERYDFDRELRRMLFSGIKQIEIGVRARLVNLLSESYGEWWLLNSNLFETESILKNGIVQTTHLHTLSRLQEEFKRAQAPFILDHHRRFPGQPVESWHLMELSSFGTFAKIYKSLERSLPERARLAKEMGVNSPHVFTGWLEAIALMRNIIAHHMPLWDRTMKKWPSMKLKNPCDAWFAHPLEHKQLSKAFLTISCIVYLCNRLAGSDGLKRQILSLIKSYPAVPIYKYGFFNHWEREPIWRE